MTAARLPRIRGIWLAGLVALSVLTFGIVPHTAASGSVHGAGTPVVQNGGHPDQVVLTRTSSAHLATLKAPASYGDLAVATALLGLVGSLFAARRGRLRRACSLRRDPRLSRAPPLTA